MPPNPPRLSVQSTLWLPAVAISVIEAPHLLFAMSPFNCRWLWLYPPNFAVFFLLNSSELQYALD